MIEEILLWVCGMCYCCLIPFEQEEPIENPKENNNTNT
jgi:hypothetical protein